MEGYMHLHVHEHDLTFTNQPHYVTCVGGACLVNSRGYTLPAAASIRVGGACLVNSRGVNEFSLAARHRFRRRLAADTGS